MAVEFDRIHGNRPLKEHFSKDIESSSMLHAFILEGEKGSAKYTFALNIAAAMCCTNTKQPCGICENCRKIYGSIYPDVTVVDLPEGRATIPVDAIREIRNDAMVVPSEGNYKFYIIKNAEKMTVQAQNALLKILEEPPSFVVFILLCTNASQLLPTVISRAPIFRMQRFTCDELEEYLLVSNSEAQKLKKNDPDAFQRILRSCDGSIGNALSRMNRKSLNGTSRLYTDTDKFFTALIATDKRSFIACEDIIPVQREEFAESVAIIRVALRDILAVKKDISLQPLFFSSNDAAAVFATAFTLKAIVCMISLCDETLLMNERNANINLHRINFINKMWQYAHYQQNLKG